MCVALVLALALFVFLIFALFHSRCHTLYWNFLFLILFLLVLLFFLLFCSPLSFFSLWTCTGRGETLAVFPAKGDPWSRSTNPECRVQCEEGRVGVRLRA